MIHNSIVRTKWTKESGIRKGVSGSFFVSVQTEGISLSGSLADMELRKGG